MAKRFFLFLLFIFSLFCLVGCVTVTETEKYIVTFETFDGSNVEDALVARGEYIKKPADPVKEGYDFNGWYKDSTTTLPWKFESDVVTTDITLYAKWDVITYTVSFESNGGSEVQSIGVSHGSLLEKPSDPTYEGYNFVGWYKESDLINEWNFSNEYVLGNISLYAKWELANPNLGDKTPTIYLAGDSTVKTYEENQYIAGWGQYLKYFLDSNINVINCANGGRSSRSFINEGRLFDINGNNYRFTENGGRSIESSIKSGDYLFIQFGHNDDASKLSSYTTIYDRMVQLGNPDKDGIYPTTPGEKVSTSLLPSAYTDQASATEEANALSVIAKYGDTYYSYDSGTYKWYLKQYIDLARIKGATPVLITPVARVKFQGNTIIGGPGRHGDNFAYVEAVRQLAKEENCLLIDLFKNSKDMLETATSSDANYLMALKPNSLTGAWPNGYDSAYGNSSLGYTGIEATHYNKYGAYLQAAFIADHILNNKEMLSNDECFNFYKNVFSTPTLYIETSSLMNTDKVKLLESMFDNIKLRENNDDVITPTPTPDDGKEPDRTETNLANVVVYMVGDSTMCLHNDTTYYYPRYGFGTQFENYLYTNASVVNLALSGRSSKSFILENNYTTLVNSLKQGDYLIIGFGHNDEKSDDEARFTDASKDITDNTSFKYYLYEYYIKLALDKGATPILVTPIVRANSKNDYTSSSAHITSTGDYSSAIVELGNAYNITVIDLTEITKAKYSSLGYNEAMYYHAFTAGMYDTDGTTIIPNIGTVDNTHLNIYGAKFVAYSLAKELLNSDNELGKYVMPNIIEPKKESLEANPNYKVPSYRAPNLSTYSPASQFTTISDGWYGTAFGDTGGNPESSSNGYFAKEETEGVFSVGQLTEAGSYKGKITSSSEGFAYLFRQIDKTKNFTITADIKVVSQLNTNQAGFGLMLRDDIYLPVNDKTILSNYVACGMLATGSSKVNMLFSRESSVLSLTNDTLSSLYKDNDTITCTISRVGQSITTTVVYSGQTYTKTYVDFDLEAMDNNYMYLGFFAARGTVIEVTDINFEITGTSQGA